VDKDGLPAAGGWVVAVPDVARRTTQRLLKSQATDQYGKFDRRGLPPGADKLFAWDGAESNAWEDQDFLKPFEEEGTKIEVRDEDAMKTNLTVISIKHEENDKTSTNGREWEPIRHIPGNRGEGDPENTGKSRRKIPVSRPALPSKLRRTEKLTAVPARKSHQYHQWQSHDTGQHQPDVLENFFGGDTGAEFAPGKLRDLSIVDDLFRAGVWRDQCKRKVRGITDSARKNLAVAKFHAGDC